MAGRRQNKRRMAVRRKWKSAQVKKRTNKLRRQVHLFKRTCNLGIVTSSVTGGIPSPIAQAYAFNLNQLPNVSEFTNLFDQYKITGAKLSFVPGASESLYSPISGTSTANGFARFHSVIDYDDTTTPPSEDAMLQYGSLKTTGPMQTHVRYIKPKILHEIYRSAIATGYAPRAADWIDVGTPDVPHYGIKVWCNAPTSGTNTQISYTVYLTLYFACKNTR